MKKFEKMSDSEMEIMKAIWELATSVTIAQLLDIFEHRKWKTQTMATFLARLADKGLIYVNSDQRANIYTAAISEQKYYQLEAQALLGSMYDGSLQNFLSALYGGGEIEANEVAELKEWFERMGKND